jgi:Fe-S-cluster-containing dehydrogenase component
LDAGIDPACVKSCPTNALRLINLATFNEPNAVQFPPGYPHMSRLNPSTRFRQPELPKIIKPEDQQ